jgi:hypothetical protein
VHAVADVHAMRHGVIEELTRVLLMFLEVAEPVSCTGCDVVEELADRPGLLGDCLDVLVDAIECRGGGPRNNRLFITATTAVYSLMMSVTGAPRIGP